MTPTTTIKKRPPIWHASYSPYARENSRVAVVKHRWTGKWMVLDHRTPSGRNDLSLPPGAHSLAITYADFLSRRAPAHDRL